MYRRCRKHLPQRSRIAAFWTVFVNDTKRHIARLQSRWPGVATHRAGDRFVVDVPAKYDVGHESHFGQVTSDFLRFLREGTMPAWEVPNMLVKYGTIMQAYEMSRTK